MPSIVRTVEPRKPRFSVQAADGAETVSIPARRNWIVLPFLCLWLVMWAGAGTMAAGRLLDGDVFLLIWFSLWVLVGGGVVALVLWQVAGSEQISVEGGDLHHRIAVPGFSRTRIYRGSEIGRVRASPATWYPWGRMALAWPSILPFGSGSASFDHGARTVTIAQGLDEAEGALIADWLRQRLSPAASPQL